MTSERLDSSTPSPPERPVSGLILSGLAELALGALTGWPYALAVTDPERARRVGIRSMIVSPLRPTISLRATNSLGTLGPMPRTTKSPSRTASARTATARMTSREHKSGGKVLAKDLEPRKGSPAWRPVERTQFLIDTVGGVTKLARTLGVAASQPSRWRSGKEVPSPEIASKLLDLDHVVALAVQAWDPAVVMDWMTTSNGFLDGAQPIKVLLQRGSPEVIDALKATISGAYV